MDKQETVVFGLGDRLSDAVASVQPGLEPDQPDAEELAIVVEFMEALRIVRDLHGPLCEAFRPRLLATIRKAGDTARELHDLKTALFTAAPRHRSMADQVDEISRLDGHDQKSH